MIKKAFNSDARKTTLGKNFLRASLLGFGVLAAGCSTTSGLDPGCCMTTQQSSLVFGLFGSQTRQSFDKQCALTQAANLMLKSDDPDMQVSGYSLIQSLYNPDKELSPEEVEARIKETLNRQKVLTEAGQTFRCETEITNGKKEILIDTCRLVPRLPPLPAPLPAP